MMTIKGRLLSITASVKHFQTEKVHPSDRFPFPLEFRNHNVVIENVPQWWLQGGEKSLMISLSVSIEYRRVTDGQTDTRRQQRPR